MRGFVVDYSSQPPVVTDGPNGETKELFGGFWIVDVALRELVIADELGICGNLDVVEVTGPTSQRVDGVLRRLAFH